MNNSHSPDALQMARLAAAPSNWRILNLYATTRSLRERHGDEAGTFFQNRRLSESIILKHTLREHERDMFDQAPVVATKVLVPLQGRAITSGAISFFIGERAYPAIMRQSFGLRVSGAEIDRDAAILARLSETPSLDLFLLRELFAASAFRIPAAYFQVSLLEDDAIRAYITRELAPLIRMATSSADPAKVGRFVESIFGDEVGPQAADFFRSMGLAEAGWAGVAFAWKAALFYETRFLDTQRRFVAMLGELASVKSCNFSETYPRSLVEEHLASLKGFIGRAYQRSLSAAQAFNSQRRATIIASSDTLELKRYLEDLPKNVSGFGGCIAIVEHILSYWSYRTRELDKSRVPAEILCALTAAICSIEKQFRLSQPAAPLAATG